MKKISKKTAFTLVELMVVVTIIGILLFLVLAKYENSIRDSKIRTFEANTRTLIMRINESYSKNNEKIDYIFDEVNVYALSLKGKPQYSSYGIDKNTKQLICELDKLAFNGNENYIIKYDVQTQKIVQEPYGINGENLIKGATNLMN